MICPHFGAWSTVKTSLAQLAAKGAQLPKPVEVSPEALHQRMTAQALAFLQEMIQSAFAKLHASDAVCDEGLFTHFTSVQKDEKLLHFLRNLFTFCNTFCITERK